MPTFSIKFQTAEIISPPYSHAIEINGEIVQNQDLSLSFELTYLNREGLTIDEIEEEGFTENDNFEWKGQLPSIWNDIIYGCFKSSKQLKISELKDEQDFWELTFENQTWYPADANDWKYLIEELQQAVYEKAGLEAPLNLTFLKIHPNQKTELNIAASFAHRELILQRNIFDSKPIQKKYLDWEELNFILKNTFSGEFIAEEAFTKKPNRNGNFVNIGDEFWYEVGKSLRIESHKIDKIWKL
jgi:hypothetical protein